MAFVDRLRLWQFGCFPELDVQLSPLTVLVGPNDSGKSTLLRALWALHEITPLDGQARPAVDQALGMPSLRWAGAPDSAPVRLVANGSQASDAWSVDSELLAAAGVNRVSENVAVGGLRFAPDGYGRGNKPSTKWGSGSGQHPLARQWGPSAKTPLVRLESLRADLRRIARFRFELKGHAPDLLALVAPEIVEELAKAREQVTLGEQQVDREADTQAVMQFADAQADRLRLALGLGLCLGDDVRQTDTDQDTIDRAPFAVLLQQVEKTQPGAAVNLFATVLGHVAAGSVQEHRLIGEKPVTIRSDLSSCLFNDLYTTKYWKTPAKILLCI